MELAGDNKIFELLNSKVIDTNFETFFLSLQKIFAQVLGNALRAVKLSVFSIPWHIQMTRHQNTACIIKCVSDSSTIATAHFSHIEAMPVYVCTLFFGVKSISVSFETSQWSRSIKSASL